MRKYFNNTTTSHKSWGNEAGRRQAYIRTSIHKNVYIWIHEYTQLQKRRRNDSLAIIWLIFVFHYKLHLRSSLCDWKKQTQNCVHTFTGTRERVEHGLRELRWVEYNVYIYLQAGSPTSLKNTQVPPFKQNRLPTCGHGVPMPVVGASPTKRYSDTIKHIQSKKIIVL